MNVNLKQRFQEILEDNRILEAELMSRHTTFRIGGPADFFLVPENADEIKKIIAVCKEKNVPYFILGNGSNLLVSDKGYQGVVVQLYRNFGQIRVEDSRIHAQAGALLSGIAAAAREASLTGFGVCRGNSGNLRRRCGDECRSVWRRNEGCSERSHGSYSRGRSPDLAGR